jgi:hypothetical protein
VGTVVPWSGNHVHAVPSKPRPLTANWTKDMRDTLYEAYDTLNNSFVRQEWDKLALETHGSWAFRGTRASVVSNFFGMSERV